MEFNHTSVLLNESIEGLNIKPEGIYVDGTLGGAGHASVVAGRLTGKGRLIGIDQDEAAIEAATARLEPFKEHVTIVRDNYRNTPAVLRQLQIDGIDGMLLDLGVSSYQLDNEERGFSYRYDTPLDMRMDQRILVVHAHRPAAQRVHVWHGHAGLLARLPASAAVRPVWRSGVQRDEALLRPQGF